MGDTRAILRAGSLGGPLGRQHEGAIRARRERTKQRDTTATECPLTLISVVGREVAEASAAGIAYHQRPTAATARTFAREAAEAETALDRLRDAAARVTLTAVQGAKGRRVYGAVAK